ncbi:ankyrin [Lindgomyces ingoldianus]|uniref:Ankyrin n=1 Tax=Lindgomyces ingoldianus TaxID=673940 RepID=A0ACB6RGL3_9PLEO|nr:ankyrin [Lindgomyces ingoldianus]KAF2477457.1 ankyrin [Lindgomyces ingoldianus]
MRILEQTSPAGAEAPPAIRPERAMTNNLCEVNRPIKSRYVVNRMVEDSAPLDSTFSASTDAHQPSNQLERYLSKLVDPIDLRVDRFCEIGGSLIAANFRAGHVITRRWSAQGQETYNVLSAQSGYSISFMVQPTRIKLRLSIATFFLYQFAQWSDVSLRFQLRVSSLMTIDHPAYLAAVCGDWLTLRKLLTKSDVRVTDQTANGDTLLHIAVSRNQTSLVKELLRHGADVNATNDQSETPLHIAVACMCDYEVSRCLISSGANMLHQDLGKKTPLHTYFNENLRKILEFHRDNIDTTIRDSEGMTISHYVSFTKQSSPEDIARSLGPHPSNICSTDHEGRTILHLALRRGNLELVKYLFEQGIEALEQPDHHGHTLMHYATESRRIQLIDFLNLRGHSIRARDKTGRTVLHHAASKGKLAAVIKLLELGAASDLDALDLDSRTPIQVAALFEAHAVVEYLQKLCKPQMLVYPGRAMQDARSAVAGADRFTKMSMLVSAKYLYCLLFLVGFSMGVLYA